jgi:PncC family amidohydrolase
VSAGTSLGPALLRLGKSLHDRDLTIAVAESCTGGLLAAALADLPESSQRFLGGVVSYATDKKVAVLGVPSEAIERDGVISETTACEMAEAARRLFQSDVALGVTGVAGPGPQDGKPVGLTYIGACFDQGTKVREYHWPGGRFTNRAASVEAAIDLAVELLEETPATR